jgi:hypothetical protein
MFRFVGRFFSLGEFGIFIFANGVGRTVAML